MEVHRLVNEFDLDWIFNCINRGKIGNMVGGNVTHKQTTFRDKYIKDAIGREKGRSWSSSQMC